ncbi:hypothetical protein SUGI_1125220 [Cryptomeria japonica]|uniref:probable eukaryotic translation initiation factor 5-1 n=1 Tax=Cryptomeria japonica TaxID=3369 RepID=UPI002414A31A|nr:probable eukaryotic translation initiation factor 5-1 [Cryptomeria japonica]GLJ52815.1 hypothetical protein SUGI_1125220 [Cryptomeria japonica]
MALLNIGASNRDDAFYRYKMPKMITKIEGRGNGIKTNVVNMVDVAKALGRPPSYTTKYFGCELGAQSKFDEKTGTSLVNGSHDTAKLAALLEIFIKKYVQCYGCGNPETEILISKTQMITLKCAACGYVSEVDMRDKLTTFILKNPPEKKGGKDKKSLRRAEKERLKAGETADEDMKKAKKETKKKVHESVTKTSKKKGSSDEDHSPGSQDDEDNGDDDVQWQTDTSIEAAKQRIKEQLTSATSEMVILENTDLENSKPIKKSNGKNGEVEVDNVSPKKPEQDDAEIDSNINELSALSIHDDLVLAFKNKMKKKNASTPSQLASFMQSSNGSPQEIMNAYFEALFNGAGKGFSKEVTKNKQFLSEVVQDENSQKLLLGAVEAFCNHARVEAVKEVPLVLKFLYDEEILEEEIIYEWFDKGTTDAEKKALPIWKNVKPFVEWLKNAEAESEED